MGKVIAYVYTYFRKLFKIDSLGGGGGVGTAT